MQTADPLAAIAAWPLMRSAIRMMKRTSKLLALAVAGCLSSTSVAEVSTYHGTYGEQGGVHVFVPCMTSEPHLANVLPYAKADIDRFIDTTGGGFITVKAELLDKEQDGFDKIAVIHEVVYTRQRPQVLKDHDAIMRKKIQKFTHNRARRWTARPLRGLSAAERGRCAAGLSPKTRT